MHAFRCCGVGRSVFFALAMVSLPFVNGCGRRNVPTDVPTARQSLTTALESWKAGDPPSKIREGSPSILMVEPAWEGGQKLESFEIVGPDVDDGVNLTCPVKLVWTDSGGKKSAAQITYVVGTSPVITIFRDRSSY